MSKVKVARSRDASNRCRSINQSITKRPRNTKIGRKIAHAHGQCANTHHFKVKRSRSRLINADTESVSYLWNGMACIRVYELQGSVHLKKFLKPDIISKKPMKKISELEYLLYLPISIHGNRRK